MDQSKFLTFSQSLPTSHNSQEYQDLGRAMLHYPFEISSWSGSVLCLLIEDGFFFIKRSEQMPRHKGQLAMVGGLRKVGESSPVQSAQREFIEETNIDISNIKICGPLPPVNTATKTLVIPILATTELSVKKFFQLIETNGEWDQGIWVPFDFLAQEENWTFAKRVSPRGSGGILFCGLPSNIIRMKEKSLGENHSSQNYLLWGASARVIWNLMRLYFSHKMN